MIQPGEIIRTEHCDTCDENSVMVAQAVEITEAGVNLVEGVCRWCANWCDPQWA